MTLESFAAKIAAAHISHLQCRLAGLEEQIAALGREAEQIRADIERIGREPTAFDGCTMPAASARLTMIRGIDGTAAGILNGLGITAFEDIAALTAEDVAEIGTMLGDPRRISRQGWIEQAAILSTGALTDFAARIVRGEAAALAAMPSGPVVTEEPAAIAPPAGEAPAEPTTEEPLLLTPAAPQVVDLAERRKAQGSRGSAKLRSAGRWAALTASLLFVLGIAIEGTGLQSAVTGQIGTGPACDSADAASGDECPQIAQARD